MRRPPVLRLLLALPLLGACGDGDPVHSAGPGGGPVLAAVERSSDPRLADARAALESGRLDSARTLLGQLGLAAGVEGPLCLARVELYSMRPTEAFAAVERARALDPRDPRVSATAAELFATLQRLDQALEELVAGVEACGPSPDLERARAVHDLFVPGGGPAALARLEKALAADPSLPYTTWPLSQAHLLAGGALLGEGDPQVVLDHARAALALDGDLVAALVLEGDALEDAGAFGAAIAAYDRAEARGWEVPQANAVRLEAALAARVDQRFDEAEALYLGLLARGVPRIDLGSGADWLDTRAQEAFERGVQDRINGDHSSAAERFARVLALDPGRLDALDELAAARFGLRDWTGAAKVWADLQGREALLEAAGQQTPGASPTVLNRTRALVLAGRPVEARELLEAYLAEHPTGPLVGDVREMLGRLPG